MPNDPYQDWLLVIALALTVVALGAVVDFMLKERDVTRLHGRFTALAAILRETPLRVWQLRIAEAFIQVLSKLHRMVLVALVAVGRHAFQSPVPAHPWLGYVQALALSLALVWGLSVLFRTEVMSSYGWILKSCGMLAALLPLALLDFIKRTLVSDIISSSIVISLAVTTAALLLSTIIPAELLDSHWFTIQEGTIVPRYPLYLNAVNWIFDFTTISFSILFLSYVKKHRRLIAAHSDESGH